MHPGDEARDPERAEATEPLLYEKAETAASRRSFSSGCPSISLGALGALCARLTNMSFNESSAGRVRVVYHLADVSQRAQRSRTRISSASPICP